MKWQEMGAHEDEMGRAVFRVWAPRAEKVCLVGDFVGWQIEEGIPMTKDAQGIFALVLDRGRVKEGDHYGFFVTHENRSVLKNDPYAFRSQPHSLGSSRYYPFPRGYAWRDGLYCRRRERMMSGVHEARTAKPRYPFPMLIYELHLGSFRADCQTYRQAADFLLPYLKQMGYTHVELMPLAEYPYGGSWGYQCMSYFAPSSRYGEPEDLMYLVDHLHQGGIGVILDWVPAHFPRDEKGLFEFDGEPLYEYADPLRADMPGWGTRCFDFQKESVREFLIQSALYWIGQYHLDGIRVDAVSAMLYRDYGRADGQWRAGENGSKISEDGVFFLQSLTDAVHEAFPHALLIAEESSAWPGVTHPTAQGGLGFDMKWNMGFASDSFDYLALDPIYRQYHHKLLTFSMTYAFHEMHLLPISHDEVVYGKRSLFSKIWGDDRLKCSLFRVFYLYFLTFPGKKLTFMGTGLAMRNEWNWQDMLPFDAPDEAGEDEEHASLRDFVREANRFYLASPALWRNDEDWAGFEWLAPDEASSNLLAYVRYDPKRGERLLCLICFAGCGEVTVGPWLNGRWQTVFAGHAGRWKDPLPGVTYSAPFALIAKALPSPEREASKKKPKPM